MTTPILRLTEISQSQTAYLDHNAALRQLEVFVGGSVISRSLTTPPTLSSPTDDGKVYIPATGATGAWSGKANQLAVWSGGVWFFYTPVVNFRIYSIADSGFIQYNGSSWTPITASGDMLKSIYDTNDNGIVDLSAATNLVLGTTTANQYYGTNASNVKGFYTLPSSSGDMTKAIYDTNDNGIVDQAAAISGSTTANQYYGTNGSNVKGFYTLPSDLNVLVNGLPPSLPVTSLDFTNFRITTGSTSSLLSGLSAYYSMNESSGNRLSSVSAPALEPVNSPDFSATGNKSAGALYISGTNQYLRSTSSFFDIGSDSFTFAAWWYPISYNFGSIVSKYDSAGNDSVDSYLLLINNNGTLQMIVRADTLVATGTSPVLALNTWHCVIGWYNRATNELGLQVNGGTPITATCTGNPKTVSTPFQVGTYNAAFGGSFRIDELAFWKRSLSAQERLNFYATGSGLFYPFTVADGTLKIYDANRTIISTTGQAITANTDTALSFDTEVIDFNDVWSISQPTRFTAFKDGYYLLKISSILSLGTTAASGSPHYIQAWFQLNTSSTKLNLQYNALPNSTSIVLDFEIRVKMLTGDYLQAFCNIPITGSLPADTIALMELL
jgi:hypothetical protein